MVNARMLWAALNSGQRHFTHLPVGLNLACMPILNHLWWGGNPNFRKIRVRGDQKNWRLHLSNLPTPPGRNYLWTVPFSTYFLDLHLLIRQILLSIKMFWGTERRVHCDWAVHHKIRSLRSVPDQLLQFCPPSVTTGHRVWLVPGSMNKNIHVCITLKFEVWIQSAFINSLHYNRCQCFGNCKSS